MDKETLEAIQRLGAAVPNEEKRRDAFAAYLESYAQDEGLELADITDAQRLELKPRWASTLLAEVYPSDVVTAARVVKEPTPIVRDLKMGSVRAKKVKPDGTPNRVWILARDLEHLLAVLAKQG